MRRATPQVPTNPSARPTPKPTARSAFSLTIDWRRRSAAPRSAKSTGLPGQSQVAAEQRRQIARGSVSTGAQPDRELSHRNRRQTKFARRLYNTGMGKARGSQGQRNTGIHRRAQAGQAGAAGSDTIAAAGSIERCERGLAKTAIGIEQRQRQFFLALGQSLL